MSCSKSGQQICLNFYHLKYNPLSTTTTGTRNDSRIEYGQLPGRQLDGFDLSITFRTFDKHGGLIFYAASDRAPEQFLALYMQDARV